MLWLPGFPARIVELLAYFFITNNFLNFAQSNVGSILFYLTSLVGLCLFFRALAHVLFSHSNVLYKNI